METEIQHPSLEGIQKIINSLPDMGRVDMDNCGVPTFYPDCGAILCIAGYIAEGGIAEHGIDKLKGMIKEMGSSRFRSTNFVLGANLADYYTGTNFALWAKKYPKIWGNIEGYGMWGYAIAYGSTEKAITLSIVRKHLKGVKRRLAAYLKNQESTKVRQTA